jgi:hypothetical protein
VSGGDNLHVPHRRGQVGTTFDGKASAKLGAGNSTLILAEIGQVDFEAAARFNGGPGKNTALVNFGDLPGVEPSLVNFSLPPRRAGAVRSRPRQAGPKRLACPRPSFAPWSPRGGRAVGGPGSTWGGRRCSRRGVSVQ